MNNIHESKADKIKEVSEDNSHVVADVAKQATVVEIMNKATKGSLINDLAEAAEAGKSTTDVIAKADPPVNLDVGASLFGNFGEHSGFGGSGFPGFGGQDGFQQIDWGNKFGGDNSFKSLF